MLKRIRKINDNRMIYMKLSTTAFVSIKSYDERSRIPFF